MSYKISELFKDLKPPVVATSDELLTEAFKRMSEHGFSQLPVVKDAAAKRQYYFITGESILRAIYSFGGDLRNCTLKVKNASQEIKRVYKEDDDLFDLLGDIRDYNAVIIVDDAGELKHVVTSFDVAQYFRQWSEDLLFVREIEQKLKKIIKHAFRDDVGLVKEDQLSEVIGNVIAEGNDLRKKFKNALGFYLSKVESGAGAKINVNIADEAFDSKYSIKKLEFDSLTLDNYRNLFTNETCWQHYNNFCNENGLMKEQINRNLEDVRDIRNDLAHFREDNINSLNKEQLKTCLQWLTEIEDFILMDCARRRHRDLI